MELPVFVHARVERPEDYTVFCIEDMSSCGYVLVAKTTCSFDVPPVVEQIPKHIAALRAEQANIRARAESDTTRLEETIQKLLCIEYKPEVDPDKYGFL